MTRSDFVSKANLVYSRNSEKVIPVDQLTPGDCIEDLINDLGWMVTDVSQGMFTLKCGNHVFTFPIHEDKPMDTSLPDESATQPCKCNCVNKFNEIINRAYSECLHNSTGKDLMIEIQHLLILELMGEKE